MDMIQKNFEKFHMQNPRVYILWDRFTRRMINAGLKNGSAALVMERIRWETTIETSFDKPVKINNNYKARYARFWMEQNPEWKDYFRTRVLASNSVDSVELYDSADPNAYF